MESDTKQDRNMLCAYGCGPTPHRYRPSPEAGPYWRCSECGAVTQDERQPPTGYMVWDFYEGKGVPGCPEHEIWLWAAIGSDDEDEVDEEEGRTRDEAIDLCRRHQKVVLGDATHVFFELSGRCMRERDKARAEVERITKERDAVHARLAETEEVCERLRDSTVILRDCEKAALGEVERLRARVAGLETHADDVEQESIRLRRHIAKLESRDIRVAMSQLGRQDAEYIRDLCRAYLDPHKTE